MRFRPSTREIVYTFDEFRQLSAPAICRRYGLGDEWLDQERDADAEREMTNGSPA